MTVTETASGAHPSAVHKRFHGLRVDLPVYLKAKPGETSVLALAFGSGDLSPVPAREGVME